MPFAIPEKWKWLTIGEIIEKIIGGGTPSKACEEYWNGDIPWASVKDLKGDVLSITKDRITQSGLHNSSSNLIPKGTLIICVRMGLGKISINSIDVAINQDLKAIHIKDYLIDQKYFLYFYKSLSIKGSGSTVRGITTKDLLEMLIPMPPLEEQHRIVEKIKKLFEQIDSAEKAYNELSGPLSERFRQLCLEKAIQGKLVPQLESELEVEQIGEAPEDVPFAIPEKWKWVLFSDAVKVISSRPFQIKAKEVLEQGLYPVISQSKEQIDGYSNDDKKLIPDSELPIIIFGDHTRTLKYVDFRFVVGADGTKLLHVKTSSIDPKYFYIALQSMIGQTRQRGYSRHFQFLKVLHIPIPPIEEQRRIVAKLNELLDSTSQLERTISTP